ncbi:MAG TPA: hypothetical protein VFM94_05145 [Solirubrobacterales bacterium]|nr:hypothetical protein [Solirubrobacterales bacterium]
MRKSLGTLAVAAVALLAIAPFARGEEQTRETYKSAVEPICQANREANERIMEGARDRVNKGKLELAGKQFIRLSGSFGAMIAKLLPIPAPPADDRRIDRWFEQMRLLKQRLRNVGKYYKAGEKIKATHESILAERAGITANNTTVPLHFHYCRFSHIKGT